MLINVYGDIGKTIHEQQQIAKWGTSVVEQLARDLKKSFPGMKGFSSRNLWRMKDFYQSYHGREKLSALLTDCEVLSKKTKKHWRDDKDLMSFLNSL